MLDNYILVAVHTERRIDYYIDFLLFEKKIGVPVPFVPDNYRSIEKLKEYEEHLKTLPYDSGENIASFLEEYQSSQIELITSSNILEEVYAVYELLCR